MQNAKFKMKRRYGPAVECCDDNGFSLPTRRIAISKHHNEKLQVWSYMDADLATGVVMKDEAIVTEAGEDIAERLIDLAVRCGKLVDELPDTRMGRHTAGQIVRCGTSPAPNYEEARGAESKRDFIHKLRICLKELRETRCWIRIVSHAKLIGAPRLNELLDECTQLMNIIGKSIVTSNTIRRKQ